MQDTSNTAPLAGARLLKPAEVMRLTGHTDRSAFWQWARRAGLPFVKMSAKRYVVEESALRAVAQKALARGTGARGLRAILEETLLDIMFELPSRDDVVEVRVTEAAVQHGVPPLLEIATARQKKEA